MKNQKPAVSPNPDPAPSTPVVGDYACEYSPDWPDELVSDDSDDLPDDRDEWYLKLAGPDSTKGFGEPIPEFNDNDDDLNDGWNSEWENDLDDEEFHDQMLEFTSQLGLDDDDEWVPDRLRHQRAKRAAAGPKCT